MDEIRNFQNECRAYYRMKNRAVQEISVSCDPYAIQYFRDRECLLAKECTRHVEAVFAEIEEDYGKEEKQMLWEHYVDGRSIKETSQLYDVPYYTLKAKAKRIVQRALKDVNGV